MAEPGAVVEAVDIFEVGGFPFFLLQELERGAEVGMVPHFRGIFEAFVFPEKDIVDEMFEFGLFRAIDGKAGRQNEKIVPV